MRPSRAAWAMVPSLNLSPRTIAVAARMASAGLSRPSGGRVGGGLSIHRYAGVTAPTATSARMTRLSRSLWIG